MYLNLPYLMKYFVISNIYSQPMVTFQVSNKVDNIHVHKLPFKRHSFITSTGMYTI